MASYRPSIHFVPQLLPLQRLPQPPTATSMLAEVVPFASKAHVLPEVLAALTYALDLAANERTGYTLRCCILGMNLAQRLHLSAEDSSDLFYALMLNSLGTPRERFGVSEWLGMDSTLCRHALRGFDWRQADRARAKFLMKHAFRNKGPLGRLVGMASLLSRREIAPALQHRRSPAGIGLARTLGLSEGTVAAMQGMDERWDGTGSPQGLYFEATSLLSQICCVAQDLAAFGEYISRSEAVGIIEKNSGRRYDPAVAVAVITAHEASLLWVGTDQEDLMAEALARNPQPETTPCDDAALEAICSAIAEVIDGRSRYTVRHSHGVAQIAAKIGTQMQLSEREMKTLRCAALLHDIGKLGVPAHVLDKEGPLTPTQMSSVRQSPLDAYAMLRRIRSFDSIALLAKTHHERLDGSGYPEGLAEQQISRLSRILAVAEAYDALSSARSYRSSYTEAEVMALLEADIPTALDAATFEALKRAITPSQRSARFDA